METQPAGISPSEFKALAEQRRFEKFLAACRLPGAWLYRANQHKRGADILYDVAYSASQRDIERQLTAFKDKQSPQCVSRTLEGQELQDFHDEGLLGEYLLLMGYAMECVLKGYLLAVIPELVIDEKRIDRLVANHDLAKLCHECAIALSIDEVSLLKLMTRHIVWGKYTAPLTVAICPVGLIPMIRMRNRWLLATHFTNAEFKALQTTYSVGHRLCWSRSEKIPNHPHPNPLARGERGLSALRLR